MKNIEIRQEVAFKNNSEVFKRLAQIANVATLTSEERYHYEADVKNARDTLNQIRTAYHDGRKDGKEEGTEKGIVKGREEERMEGIRFMLTLGISPETIAQRYGLTIEVVLAMSH